MPRASIRSGWTLTWFTHDIIRRWEETTRFPFGCLAFCIDCFSSTLKECPHTCSGRLLQSRFIHPSSIRGYYAPTVTDRWRFQRHSILASLVAPWLLHTHVTDWWRLSPERALRTQAGVKRSETPVRKIRQKTKYRRYDRNPFTPNGAYNNKRYKYNVNNLSSPKIKSSIF